MSNHGSGCRRRDVDRRRELLPEDELRLPELLDRLRLLLLRLLELRLLEDLRVVLRLVIAQMFSYSLCIIPWSRPNKQPPVMDKL
jgi:hypothetical protein